MNRRRLLILLGVLAAIEGTACLLDARWTFRTQLLNAFQAAEHQGGGEEPSTQWTNPDRLFEPGYNAFSQALRFRAPEGPDLFGHFVPPEDLPGHPIFVLGESAAFGVGVKGEETFASILDQHLKPQGVRVVNAGQQGATPWQVLDAGAQLLARYSPSTLVIFTGNNQWMLWSPPQQRAWNPWAVRILSTLATSRAVAGLELLLIRTLLQHRASNGSFQDHHEATGSSYALQFPLEATPTFGPSDWLRVKQTYLDHYRTSLEVLVRQARSRNVRVVLVTVPFNYRLAPSWKHPQFEAFDPAHKDQVRELLHAAARLKDAGNCGEGVATVDKALALDAQPPVLHYVRAECLEKLGRLDEAEAAYAQSREKMLGNLGSRLSVNEIIRDVASREQVPLVDAVKLFDDYEHQNGKHFGDGLFVDDCHPTPVGHRLIADAVEPLLRQP